VKPVNDENGPVPDTVDTVDDTVGFAYDPVENDSWFENDIGG
jgi:hypothetical protein